MKVEVNPLTGLPIFTDEELHTLITMNTTPAQWVIVPGMSVTDIGIDYLVSF